LRSTGRPTMTKEQSLVGAQTEINRAVFAMNQELNKGHKLLPDYIRKRIDSAIKDLEAAREGYTLPQGRKGKKGGDQ
jgi:hypothetical protein